MKRETDYKVKLESGERPNAGRGDGKKVLIQLPAVGPQANL